MVSKRPPSASAPSGPSSQPLKRQRVDSLSDSNEDKHQYVYSPKCDHCKDRGWVCYVAQQGDRPRCVPCKIAKCRCSAYRGENYVIKRHVSVAGTKKATTNRSISGCLYRQGAKPLEPTSPPKAPACPEEPNSKDGPPSGRWMREKQVERAAMTLRSSNALPLEAPSVTTPLSSTTPSPPASPGPQVATSFISDRGSATPKRKLVDKSVATETQPGQKFGPQEAEFMKSLVSLILEVIQTRQNAPATGLEDKKNDKMWQK